ncbi:MAG: hypothetical protein IPH50_12860 [Rhodanobacteraceae bacterium]|nr:hypothetical protein [Rhodanobacteraceae bacterium]
MNSSTLRCCLTFAVLAMLVLAQSLAFARPMARADTRTVHMTTVIPTSSATPPCHRRAAPVAATPAMPCCDEQGTSLGCCDGACTCVGLMLADLSIAMQRLSVAAPVLASALRRVGAPMRERIPPLPPPIRA